MRYRAKSTTGLFRCSWKHHILCTYLIPKLSLFPLYCYYYTLHCYTIILHVIFCWWVDGILLLLLYSYIIIIPVVHGRFTATATAAAAADRCSFSLISPLAVVAVVWLLLVWYLLSFCVLMPLLVWYSDGTSCENLQHVTDLLASSF